MKRCSTAARGNNWPIGTKANVDDSVAAMITLCDQINQYHLHADATTTLFTDRQAKDQGVCWVVVGTRHRLRTGFSFPVQTHQFGHFTVPFQTNSSTTTTSSSSIRCLVQPLFKRKPRYSIMSIRCLLQFKSHDGFQFSSIQINTRIQFANKTQSVAYTAEKRYTTVQTRY